MHCFDLMPHLAELGELKPCHDHFICQFEAWTELLEVYVMLITSHGYVCLPMLLTDVSVCMHRNCFLAKTSWLLGYGRCINI